MEQKTLSRMDTHKSEKREYYNTKDNDVASKSEYNISKNKSE